MSKIIQSIETEQIGDKKIPDFRPGDTVVVKVKVREANRERLQAFEGVVIAKRNRGINSAFTVRKMSHGEGVERIFQTYSPMIASITVKRRGDVNRAKLYYLRELTGKKARIKEKIRSGRTVEAASAADVPEEELAATLDEVAPVEEPKAPTEEKPVAKKKPTKETQKKGPKPEDKPEEG